jgi:hypothetical protein
VLASGIFRARASTEVVCAVSLFKHEKSKKAKEIFLINKRGKTTN